MVVLVLGLILVPKGRRFFLVGVVVVLVMLVVLDGAVVAVAGIKDDFRAAAAAAGATASLSVDVLGVSLLLLLWSQLRGMQQSFV